MIVLGSSLLAAAEPEVPPEWRTVAESSGFRATSSYEETLDFLRRLGERFPEMRLEHYGESPQGRPLPVVIVSKEHAFTPGAARRLEKPIVLIQNGIHSGEIDGKDASLMILRDWALGHRRELLDAATVLILPILNVDGHERVSPWNRPNQNGPAEGMGFRTTAAGLDLNRDHLKLTSREMRAAIALFDAWRPHLHVDNHVTDGSDHAWVLTWSWAEAPQLAPSLDAWMKTHMPPVLTATEGAGHRVGPYVDLEDRQDPSRGFSSRVVEPRYATGYYPLRNRPSILVEMHSYKPYRERVLANRDFLLALLAEIGRAPKDLVEAVAAAEARVVALGAPDAPPSEVVLAWEKDPAPDRVRFPVYAWHLEPSIVLGAQVLGYRRSELRELEVDWFHRSVPGLTVPRPRGYLVLPGWEVIEERLAVHGLAVSELTAPAALTVETIRFTNPEPAPSSYQGLTRLTAAVERRRERVEIPAGTLWIGADQPGFEVAVQLLEPEAPDSLFSWGLLSTVTERKEYIEPRILEDLARDLLEEPEIALAWKEALADETFAADPQARYMWWYRRTPYWDDTVGLLPIFRVMEVPTLPTRPWSRR